MQIMFWVLCGVAAGHKELHITAQRAHWFMKSQVGAALISGKRLDVDLLILGLYFSIYSFTYLFIYFSVWFLCLPTDANPAIAVHKKLARIYILRAENSRAADIVMRWCFNFLLQLAGRKYYNFKLDYNLPPWSVSYVVGNNVSKSRSSIRKNNILSVPGRGCE